MIGANHGLYDTVSFIGVFQDVFLMETKNEVLAKIQFTGQSYLTPLQPEPA